MKDIGINLSLTSYDDLFETDESRANAKHPQIKDVPASLIDDFPNHPFKVRMDGQMDEMVESVKQYGILVPCILRPKGDRFEMIAGHRRKLAGTLAELEHIPCMIRDLTDDEATIIMVDTNLQREHVFPSEKAFAYKMRLEAMKRQAGRPQKRNGAPVGHNLKGIKSRDILSKDVGESREQIRRYIRLTSLLPSILNMVDGKRIAFRPAVELSYLTTTEQQCLLDAIELTDATPSLAQSIKMRKFSQENKLSHEVIESIMQEEKPNQKEKPVFQDDRINKLIPKSVPKGKEADFVVTALKHYKQVLKNRNRGQER